MGLVGGNHSLLVSVGAGSRKLRREESPFHAAGSIESTYEKRGDGKSASWSEKDDGRRSLLPVAPPGRDKVRAAGGRGAGRRQGGGY